MKKKLLGFIIAFVFMLTTGIYLTACGDDEPVFNKLVLDYKGTTYENSNISLGDFDFGKMPDLGYTVKAKYSDGSTRTLFLGDYTETYTWNSVPVQKPETLEEWVDGSYTIEIKYQDYSLHVYFNITKTSGQYSLEFENNKKTWRYTEQQPEITIKANGETVTDGATVKYFKTNTPSTANQPNPDEIANAEPYYQWNKLEPGDYFFFVQLDGLVPDETTNYTRVTVQKGLITVDLAAAQAEYTEDLFTYSYPYYTYEETKTLKDLADKINMSHVIQATAIGGGTLTDTVYCSIAFEDNDEELNYNTFAADGERKVVFVVYDDYFAKFYDVDDSAYITRTVSIERGEVAVPEIMFDKENSTSSSIKLWLATSNADFFNVLKKRNDVDEDYEFDPAKNDDYYPTLDILNAGGTYTYTLSLKSENYVWKIKTSEEGQYPETFRLEEQDQPLTWEITEFAMEDIKWKINTNNLTAKDSCVLPKTTKPFVYSPRIVLPYGFQYSYSFNNQYEWYKSDGTPLGGFSAEETGGYVIFNYKEGFESQDGHCILTGTQSRLEYTIEEVSTVVEKTFVFSDVKMFDACGEEVTSEKGLTETLKDYFNKTATVKSNNAGKTLVCGANVTTVSGDFDFGEGAISGLSYRCSYYGDVENESTVTLSKNGSILSFSGDLVGDTLTLVVHLDGQMEGYIWRFTFTVQPPVED